MLFAKNIVPANASTASLEDLDAGNRITAETLVLWGANGLVEKFFSPLQCWLRFCTNVQGHALPCGHFIPEEAPIPLLAEVQRFL